MKKIACVLFLLLFAVPVFSQDYPKVEIFGGYSLGRPDIAVNDMELYEGAEIYIPDFGASATLTNVESSRLVKKGFIGSFTYNMNSAVGIEAAFRYNSGDILSFDATVPEEGTAQAALKLQDISFGAGPKFTYRNSSIVTPFAHALIGIDVIKLDFSASAQGYSAEEEYVNHTGLGLTLGGGLDVNVSDNVAIRLIQADYSMSRHADYYMAQPDEETQDNFAFSFGVVFGLGK